MTRSSLVRRVALPAGVVALVLVSAPAASAEKVDLSGGTTAVRVDRATLAAVTGAGVAIAPTGAADASGRRVRFPISGGRLDLGTGAGRVDHRGGLRFSRNGRSLRLTRFRIRGTYLSALAGGDRVNILRVRKGNAVVRRTATTTRISRVDLELTRTAARALNATLGTSLFARGIRLGRATIHADASELFIEAARRRSRSTPARPPRWRRRASRLAWSLPPRPTPTARWRSRSPAGASTRRRSPASSATPAGCR